ncbi:unnamed protein product [Calicophoron daubneyi]|uniref:Fatty acid-binding protein n=1 Tax=Calicophoron daubneyi TaxID=300641 RepID=A0AAV2TSY2_CALDB
MARFVGTWKRVSQTNLGQLLKAEGIPDPFRSSLLNANPKVTVTVPDPDSFTVKYESVGITLERAHKFNQIFEHKTLLGKTSRILMTKESDTRVKAISQNLEDPSCSVFELVGEELHVTTTSKGIVTTEVYKRI